MLMVEMDEVLSDDEVLMNVGDYVVACRVCLSQSSDKNRSRVPDMAHVRKSS